jgi:hypothetical protein
MPTLELQRVAPNGHADAAVTARREMYARARAFLGLRA